MSAITRLGTNTLSILRFLRDWASTTPQDVEYSWIDLDEDGNEVTTTTTHPNFMKFMQQVGMKYNMETKKIVGIDDVPLEIDATTVGGKNLDYLKSVAGVRFKMLLDTTEFQGFPERWMWGVTGDNEIYHWGSESHYVNNFAGGTADSYGLNKLAIPLEKVGVSIKRVVANTWGGYVLFEDGDLYGIGYNGYGQMGVGNTTEQQLLVKVQIPIPIVDIASSSHGYHQDQNTILAIDENGELWAWGKNGYGQCGTGTTTDVYTPQKITIGGLNDDEKIVKAYVTGTNVTSTYVLTDLGRVFSCGWNGDGGALGLGDTTNRSEFSLVSGILVGVNIVKLSTAGGTRSGDSAYYRHSVQALSADGRIFNWGYGGNHELGRGDTNSSSVPLELPTADFDGQVVDIISSRASWTSYIAITDANKAYGWGGNEYGCLGVGHTSDVYTPTLLTLTNADGTENSSGIKKIFFGAGSGTYGYHHNVLIITNDMKLFSAGYGGQGQTGQNNTTSYSTFQQIRFDMVDRIVQVSTGGYSSTWAWYILLDDGRVFGWGDNDYQQVQINQSYGYRALPTLTIQ